MKVICLIFVLSFPVIIVIRVAILTSETLNCLSVHYENMPMQYTAIFHGCKNDNFQFNFLDFFHIFGF